MLKNKKSTNVLSKIVVPLPYSRRKSTRYSDRVLDFFVTILSLDGVRMTVSADYFLAQLDSRILCL